MPGTQRPCVLPPAISISSCRHDFYIITPRVGQYNSEDHGGLYGCSCSLARPQQSPPPVSHDMEFTRRRRLRSANQPLPIRRVCGGRVVRSAMWTAWKWRQTQLKQGCASLPALEGSAHADAAPPCTHASMSAHRCSFSRRCFCACADFSSKAQYSF